MQNLQQELIEILKDIDHLVIDGELNKNKVVELALQVDADLLKMLIKHPTFKNHFFTDIDGVLVFDKIAFQRFVNNKSFLPDSYTAFKNKIGLAINDGTTDNYLNSKNDTVLVWPHKDCVLEGGQTKEDQKRNEIFWNETLAPNEVDRLLDPKVFTSFKKYDADGEHELSEFKGDENLIIKGNNLLALASLKKRYAGKVKLIYIDPPYNTGSDSFGYNDNFNHSTWLTFMKNRLEVAKDLLVRSGVFMVHCSFHEFAYLKVLMDEIFEKHLCDFNIQVRHPERVLTGDKEFNDVIEYVLIYSNDNDKKMPFVEIEKTIDDYTLQVTLIDNAQPELLQCGNKVVEIYTPDKYAVKVIPASELGLKKISVRGSIREKNSSGRFFVKYLEGLTQYPPETLFKVPDMGDDSISYRFFYSAPQNKKNGGYYQGMPTSSSTTKKQYSNFYNFEKEYNNVSHQGDVVFRNGKKPEELLNFLIQIFTEPGDLVIDFHSGSGTTCAVCNKISRKYIGIEQMELQKELSIKRLMNVISGEQSGISKSVNWQGGGSFVYCELKENNQTFISALQNANSKEEVLAIWQEMQSKATLSYQFDRKTFNERLEAFKTAPLEDMKKYLIEVLDKNLLYVNYSDINDSFYAISEVDKKLNKEFYKSK